MHSTHDASGAAGPSSDGRTAPFANKYELVRRLAHGGMAEVLLARRLPAIGQAPVVIKRILPQLAAQPEFVDMFLTEARLAGLLRHPNIVRTYEFGTAENAYFIAMEYLDGVTVHELSQARVRRGEHVPYEHAIAIVGAVCAGLHYAHERRDGDGRPLQIVHRDVSPQNVVVTRAGAVKLLDFGIAKSLATSAETRQGKLKGKLRYLSPEQCRGVCDRRSDVFAAGLLLYELTLGRRAYRAETEDEVYASVAMARFDRPSTVCSSYPQALEHIVCRALARSPDDRYPTAGALKDDLERVARLLSLGSSPPALGGIVAELQDEARAIAAVSAMQAPRLERTVAGTIDIDLADETTDVEERQLIAARAGHPSDDTRRDSKME